MQQGAGANSGILIIALATGPGLVAAESEPVSDWLPRRTAQSREFHLMKGSVQQAAARGCSLRVGEPAVCHFSLSISVRARLPCLKRADMHNYSNNLEFFSVKNTPRMCILKEEGFLSFLYHEVQDFILLQRSTTAIIKPVVF